MNAFTRVLKAHFANLRLETAKHRVVEPKALAQGGGSNETIAPKATAFLPRQVGTPSSKNRS